MVADRECVGGDLGDHVEILERTIGGRALQVLAELRADAVICGRGVLAFVALRALVPGEKRGDP